MDIACRGIAAAGSGSIAVRMITGMKHTGGRGMAVITLVGMNIGDHPGADAVGRG